MKKWPHGFQIYWSAMALLLFSMVAFAQPKVVAYVPNWIDLESFSETIDFAKLTHINIAFENPETLGRRPLV